MNHQVKDIGSFCTSLSGDNLIVGWSRTEPKEGKEDSSNSYLMVMGCQEEGILTLKRLINLPDKSFGPPSLLKRVRDTNLLFVCGYQSMFVCQIKEDAHRCTVSDFFYVRQIHSDCISDLAVIGDTILTCCSKDKFISEIKLEL